MIYFDNAATTFPKPAAVVREMTKCMREYCGNPGRSSHKLALAASEAIYDVRYGVADFFGISKPENVIFTQNATQALNLAISGIARRGDISSYPIWSITASSVRWRISAKSGE